MVVRRCSSVSRGRVSPSIPCSLKTWRWGAQCQGVSAGAVRPGVASELSRESRAQRSCRCSLQDKASNGRKVSSVLGACPTLEAETLTMWGGGGCVHQCPPPPQSLRRGNRGWEAALGSGGCSEPSWVGPLTGAYSPQPDRPPTKLQTSSTVHLLTSSGAVASSPSMKRPPMAPGLGVVLLGLWPALSYAPTPQIGRAHV